MTFYGSNIYYKRMLMFGVPVTIIIFTVAFISQGEGFDLINLLLFAVSGALAGGMIVLPIMYMRDKNKRVVLEEDELRLEENGRSQTAKYSDIEEVKFNGKQIQIKLKEDKGKIDIAHVHGYPMKDIYDNLEKRRHKKSES